MAYNISQKISGGLLRLKSLIFLGLLIFSVIQRFFNFTGVEKTQQDAIPHNDCENDVAKGSRTGDVVVCFLK